MQRGLLSSRASESELHSQNFTKRKWFLIGFGPRWVASPSTLSKLRTFRLKRMKLSCFRHRKQKCSTLTCCRNSLTFQVKIFYFLDKNCTFNIECDLTTNCKPIIFFKNVRHPWSCSNLKIFNPSKHFQKEFYAFAIILNALYGAFKKIIQWQKGVE